MGFSRYSPSSLDLTNFVVWSCRGAVPLPRPAGHVEIWESVNPEIWKSGNPEFWNLEIWKFGTWKSGNLGSDKIPKIKFLKIKIRSAQNVGKVWISRKKTFPAPFGALPGHFLRGPENPDFWKSGNPEFWGLEIQNFGIHKIKKLKILKIQIRSVQNVGKVWISRKNCLDK